MSNKENKTYEKIYNILKTYGYIEENMTALKLQMLSKIYEETESSKLSIDEATKQFNEQYKDNLFYEAKTLKVQEIMLNVHLDCLRANNLIKDGE